MYSSEKRIVLTTGVFNVMLARPVPAVVYLFLCFTCLYTNYRNTVGIKKPFAKFINGDWC
jgi:hypothetical protein